MKDVNGDTHTRVSLSCLAVTAFLLSPVHAYLFFNAIIRFGVQQRYNGQKMNRST
jgi:multisubunit Na+/H+ antiporter MnhG subunit